MNRGPLPTRLVFLSELAGLPNRTKVRFLGCVTSYSLSAGTLTLRHAYPPPPSPCSTIEVDVNLLFDNLKSTDTQVGEWVNVTGYVERQEGIPWKKERNGVSKNGEETTTSDKAEGTRVKQKPARVKVQALMLWSAGGIKLSQYETALEERRTAPINSEITDR